MTLGTLISTQTSSRGRGQPKGSLKRKHEQEPGDYLEGINDSPTDSNNLNRDLLELLTRESTSKDLRDCAESLLCFDSVLF
jgi:hypothetical protein